MQVMHDEHNMAAIMQSYAAISGAIAGFAIAVIVFLIGSRRSRDRKLNVATLIEPVIASFFAAFFSVFLASLLFASGPSLSFLRVLCVSVVNPCPQLDSPRRHGEHGERRVFKLGHYLLPS